VPYRDPATAVLDKPEVAESKRFCSRCGHVVGRGHGDRPGRTEGFCTQCGANFSFAPKLAKGDIVAGQYEVLGCLAHGGLGWIYLARDHNVSERWVVLKGLLDTGDAEAMAAALAERRFLAQVEHPNIVRIYNFVQHANERNGSAVGYIVMEYVGGESLRDMLRKQRRVNPAAALPLPQVIAYGVEALRAMDYLHSLGLVYCDFKPDNVIQTEEQVKLIDLGAVRRADDDEGSVWGTIGYQAPEVAVEGPSVASDIYTVGRALAVLSFSFDFTKRYIDRLPDAAEVPVLAQHLSFHRLLLRATDPDPDRRFTSAEEMSTQLTGVLREVLAASDGQQRPGPSTLFTPERRTFGAGSTRAGLIRSGLIGPGSVEPAAIDDDPSPVDSMDPPRPAVLVAALPVPQVDTSDPAAGLLTTLAESEPAELIDALAGAAERTAEVRLRQARALIELGSLAEANAVLAALAADEPGDWRLDYYAGLAALAASAQNPERLGAARAAFDEVYGALPGEAAPKLALAACAELAGDLPAAARHYETVWRTDHSFVSAAFGLARVRLRQSVQGRGERAAAIEVLESVPVTSSHHLAAQVAAVLADTKGRPGRDELLRAGQRLGGLDLDAERAACLAVEVLSAALAWVKSGQSPNGGGEPQLLGAAFTERDLRLGLERRYRSLARLANNLDDRIALVDRANAIRPRTLV
jgi:serine/threonine-protein kinase PknG